MIGACGTPPSASSTEAPHEQRLVAVRQPGHRETQLHPQLDPSQERPALGKPEREGAAGDARISERALDARRPARRQRRVRVQEQQCVRCARGLGARGELSCAPGRAGDHACARGSGSLRSRVATAAIDDDHFDSIFSGALDRSFDALFFIARGNDDRDSHGRPP